MPLCTLPSVSVLPICQEKVGKIFGYFVRNLSGHFECSPHLHTGDLEESLRSTALCLVPLKYNHLLLITGEIPVFYSALTKVILQCKSNWGKMAEVTKKKVTVNASVFYCNLNDMQLQKTYLFIDVFYGFTLHSINRVCFE